jgi:20S proteasome alpha/beta subunit
MQKEYNPSMTVEDAMALASKAIEGAVGEKPAVIETGIVTLKDKQFRRIGPSA